MIGVGNMTVADLLEIFDQTEIWRDAPGFPSYEVSSWSRVRRRGHSAPLKQSTSAAYPHVSLSEKGTIKTVRVHILAALAFLGPRPFRGAVVAHGDGDTSNNKIKNFRWATHRENQADRLRHDTHVFGSDVHRAKLSEADIPLIRHRIASGEKYPRIAAAFGVSISTICLIKKNKIWRRANGAAWRPAA